MKIRTVEQLYDFTSRELAWRRKELYSLRSLIFVKAETPSKKNVILRSLITLTYAHFEGFIKSASNAYIEYVSLQKLIYTDLSPNFIALAIRPMIMDAFQSRKAKDHLRVVEFLRNDLDTRSSISYKNAIDTRSNLSSAVLYNIIKTLGFDYKPYATKEKLIDERLLRSRNRIAHGEFLILSDDQVLEIHDQCIELMNIFRNQIDNAVATQQFKMNTDNLKVSPIA